MKRLLSQLALLSGIGLLVAPTACQATPAFARQLNAQCTACHTEYPVLNEFGRLFKVGGYTMATDQTKLPPVAFMVQAGFTHTQASVPGGAATGFHDNNNFSLNQASIFYTGRLFGPYADPLFGPTAAGFLNKIGIFYQHTYDGIGHSWAWDNAEIRYADTGSLFGKTANFGFYANNNPTMQDPWNTLPAWGFPFSSSPLAPTPAAATLIDGGVSQQVVGAGGYVLIDNKWYVDAGVYHTLGAGFQRWMGVDPAGETQIPDLAPYWRLAYTGRNEMGTSSWEIGTHGMAASTYPGRDSSAGKDQILDLGVDTQYQTTFGNNDVLGMLSWTHENQTWDASQPLALTTNGRDTLWKAAATIHLLHDKTYGVAVQYFLTDGSSDALLYGGSANGSPLSDGFVFELNWMPLNKSGGPFFWPRSNAKFTAQYILYNRFDGARSNYDGTGRNASGNNMLFLGAWIAF
ncbi:MAG: hypothetical protein DVB31_01430 [Verrucomicrobia bacterium]|nr:MAG: hypothetical protein DVB31_01430 [Verrucomicrobiota bacterium]